MAHPPDRGIARALTVSLVAFAPFSTHAQSRTPPRPCGACADYAPPAASGYVAEPALTELSGLAASRVSAGVYYAHNDSGDTARFFALDAHGTALAQFVLRGATAVDWEDIAVGPCATGSCVYLGDIGDNERHRAEIAVYRVVEPTRLRSGATDVAYERFAFRYPDGAHDAEALVVDPSHGDLYVLTKRFGGTDVYRADAPLDTGHVTTLRAIATLRIPAGWIRTVTAASAHPCQPWVLLRTYDRAFELRAPVGGALLDAFQSAPHEVPLAMDPQGEAIAYRADGRGYVAASEGAGTPIHEVVCR